MEVENLLIAEPRTHVILPNSLEGRRGKDTFEHGPPRLETLSMKCRFGFLGTRDQRTDPKITMSSKPKAA